MTNIFLNTKKWIDVFVKYNSQTKILKHMLVLQVRFIRFNVLFNTKVEKTKWSNWSYH